MNRVSLLYLQDKLLANENKVFQFINNEHMEKSKEIKQCLHKNRGFKNLYRKAYSFQKSATLLWRGEKLAVKVCPLPTLIEDETTTLGTGVVILNTLELHGLIDITENDYGMKHMKIGANKNYVLLCGDGLLQVRTKKFFEEAYSDALSFDKMYEDSLVISEASEGVIIGCGDLHCAGFSCLLW